MNDLPDLKTLAIGLGPLPEVGKQATISVRDMRMARGATPPRWWAGNDPIATAFFNALSVTFPKGEAYFVESVKEFRDHASAKLADEIRSFVKQEVNHSREHLAFNRHVTGQGYDVTLLDGKVDEVLAIARGRPKIVNLAATMALEHFTAMLAHELLANPAYLQGADAEAARLWRWHAIEEIEHKGVAYDTWLAATRTWSRWQRWRVKALTMLIVTRKFLPHRYQGIIELLRQDGLTGWRVHLKVWRYAFGNPGIVRRIVPAWLAYFRPGFHPWQVNDSNLIEQAEVTLAPA